jgi:hypothetical protein
VANWVPAIWFAHADTRRVAMTQQNPFAEKP